MWGAENDKHRKILDDMAEQWGRYGLRMDTISRQDMPDYVATDQYISGSVTHENAMMNPASYVRGLARVAQEAGAAIYTQSPATGIERQGERWRVSTLEGEVLASRVVICTNAYTADPWPGLERTFYPFRLVSFATEPCPEVARAISPKGMQIHDMNTLNFFGVFIDTAGRLVGGVWPPASRSASIEAVVKPFDRKFTRIFPGVSKPKWRYIWHGTLCIMPDKTPRIYELAPGVFAGMGYSGTGIARATVMGRELANLITTGDEEACSLWLSKPKSVPFARLVPVLLRYVVNPTLRQLFR